MMGWLPLHTVVIKAICKLVLNNHALSKEREEIKRRETNKRRQRLEAINTLVELGYNKKAAAQALHQTKGDVNEAYRV